MNKEYIILNNQLITNMLENEISIENQILNLEINTTKYKYKYLLNRYFKNEYHQYKVNIKLHRIHDDIKTFISKYKDLKSCYDYLIKDDQLHFNRRRRINFNEFRKYTEKHI